MNRTMEYSEYCNDVRRLGLMGKRLSFHVGEIIGDYRIIGIIGAGSMGRVYQAEHRITKRKEALKVLTADLANESQVARFTREIEVHARLSHPNIAAVHNAIRVDDQFVLVMELVEGQTLENLLKPGRIPLETGIEYIRQALTALSYAHENGVIHRDVTPANLMVTSSGCVKLMDFGVAKSLNDSPLTEAGSIVGSLYYMSPEQVKGHAEPNPRLDIYSVGAVLYQIATGQRPFEQEDRYSLITAQVEVEPESPLKLEPTLSPRLSAIILKALTKDPAGRFQSAQEFLNALNGHGEVIPALEMVAGEQFADRSERSESPVVTFAVAICAVIFLGGGAWSWRQMHPLPPGVQDVRQPDAQPARQPPALATQPIEAAVPEAAPTEPVVPVQKSPVPRAFVGPVMPALPPAEGTVVQEKASAPRDVQAAPETQPETPKKGRLWNKLNPFRKKKEDGQKKTGSDEEPNR